MGTDTLDAIDGATHGAQRPVEAPRADSTRGEGRTAVSVESALSVEPCGRLESTETVWIKSVPCSERMNVLPRDYRSTITKVNVVEDRHSRQRLAALLSGHGQPRGNLSRIACVLVDDTRSGLEHCSVVPGTEDGVLRTPGQRTTGGST